MRVIAIVQARMGSTRLPGKVLAELGGATMLGQVVRRLRTARRLDEVVVATTTLAADDAVVREAGRLGAGVHRGPEHDVLARYVGAARSYRADAIVRVTADCPLIDGGVVDRVIDALTDDVDYASNTHLRRYPRGLDAEAVHRDALDRIGRLARSTAAREHVTAFVVEQPALFRVAQVVPDEPGRDDADLRWTVDTEADLATVRGLYAALGLGDATAGYRDIVAAVRARPELAAGNAHVVQKPWQDSHVA
jgi:spore coat polysaccharide biosynthesis protein SpsF